MSPSPLIADYVLIKEVSDWPNWLLEQLNSRSNGLSPNLLGLLLISHLVPKPPTVSMTTPHTEHARVLCIVWKAFEGGGGSGQSFRIPL